MAQNNKTVHVVELRGELGSLEQSLSTLKQRLSGLELPKGIDDSFGKLDKVIQALQHRVADGLISPEEFKNVEKEVQQVIKQFGTLAGSLTSLQNLTKSQKLALLPEDAQARLKGVTDALAGYGNTLSAIIKLENERTAAQSKADTAKARVEAAQANDKTARDEVARIQAQIEKYGELAEAIKEQEAAERAYTEAQKELEKARRSGAGEKAIKNREEKLSKASREMEGARLMVSLTKEGMEPEQIREYEKAVEDLSAATKKQKVASTELEDALKAQTAAQGTLATVRTQLEQATADGTENAKKQKEAYDSLVAAIKKIRPGFEDVAKEGETITDKMERLRQVVDSLSDDELKKLEPALEGAGEGAREAQKGVDALGASLDKAKEETKEFNEETEKVKALKDKIKQFLGIAGAVEVFRRAARDAIQTVTELDKTMTEMAVVTDLTVGDYWNQLPEYSKQASELGVSINSAYKAATLYYQQGLKGNEVTKISAETLKMAKIAGLDTADATDKMTAALRGFNMELNETSAQKIADVYSELAAITAADVDEISSAMTKTASIASSAGMEFETTAAFLSQIIETTRESAETAGTAMKTVIARFQELKKAPEDIGEVDGEIVDANAIETALRSVGVSLRDAGGQFRELDDVFLELSSKWDGLDKNTQRYIATIAAGSRQQSRFIAMMQNYGRTQELVNAANNSAGASQRQFEKTTESLESKVEKLKNSWHEFTMGILNSDLVKFGVDVLNTFMEIINKATNSLDGLGGSLTKIASILAIFQMGKKIFQKLTPTIDDAMLKIVKKFYGYGENAAKEFKKGVEGESSDEPATSSDGKKKKREEMTPEEREEDDRQRGLAHTREGLLKQTAPKKKVTIKEALSSAKGKATAAIKGIGGAIAKPFSEAGAKKGEAKKKRDELLKEIQGLETAQQRGEQIDPDVLAAKRKQLQQAEIEIGDYSWVDQALTGGQFSDVKKKQREAQEAASRFSGLKAPTAEDTARLGELEQTHARYTALSGEDGGAAKKRQETIAALRKKSEQKNKKGKKKGLNKEDKARLAALEQEEQEYQSLMESESEYQNLRQGREEYMAAEEDFNKKSAEYHDANQKAWQSVGDTIGKAGEIVTGVGMGISAVGGILSQMGLEEVGEGFAKVGNAITLVGGALMAIPGVLKVVEAVSIQTGATMSASLWLITLIVAAVAVVAGIIAMIVTTIQHNSPEAKLERASAAADQAAEAADRAKESYEGLASSLDDLANKQTALENMTQGTDEWNKALQESNNAVLDLIEKYPELASLVENVDGQLKLDTASDEVRDVMKKYEDKAVIARGESISAQQKVNDAKLNLQASQMDDSLFDSFVADKSEARKMAWANLGGATLAGAGAGAGVAAGAAAIVNAVPAWGQLAYGASVATGALIGGVSGLVGGIATFQSTMDQVETTNETNLKNAKELAKAYADGEMGTSREEIIDYINNSGMELASSAEEMADAFLANSEELRKFGEATNAAEAANEAYYQAMATNAQQLLDIGKYSQDEISQINNAVDSDRMKAIEDTRREELKKEAEGSDSKEFKQAKEDYAKATYGDDATVDGNKIIYYDENGAKQEREMDEDAWVNAIAAADATKEAAKAMEKVPKAMEIMFDKLSGAGNNKDSNWHIVEKALTDSNKLTKNELDTFSSLVGAENGKIEAKFDGEGNRIAGGNDDSLYKLWSEDTTGTLKEVYGDYQSFLKEYQDVINNQNKAWNNITKEAKKINLVGEDGEIKGAMTSMSAEAAKTWTNLLGDVMPAGEDAGKVDAALATFLEGKTQEEVDSIMSQIGAIDATDSLAWDNLAYTLEQLGIVTNSTDSALQTFIQEAKIATNAIAKIDFSNFNNQINETIKLLNKAKEGARNYSEDEYKSFIAANKGLENDFIQVGDEFIYLGTSMKDLTDAVQENTISKLQEANRLIETQKNMAGILEDETKIGAISTNSDVEEQRSWLIDTVTKFAEEGEDVADLGIAGLTLETNFSKLDDATVKRMVEEVLGYKGDYNELAKLQEKNMRDANVAAYTTNNAAFNALQGAEGGDWADEHQDALQIQATQAGVGEVMIQSYRNAADQFNKRMEEIAKGENLNGMSQEDAEKEAKETFKMASQNLLNMMETAEENKEAQEQIDALSPLADRVAAAIEKQRQDTIDKLSDVNDSINTANDRMISKIQEQIDDARQARENQKAKDNLTDMYSQQAYLAMDTSGANALQMVDNEQAIKDAEQEYEDMMIDQAIQQLQDANEKAAEQRERQINLLQQQLDYELESGLIAEEAAQIVRESLDRIAAGDDVTNTKLGEFMTNELNTLGGMNKASAKTEWNDIIMQAINNYNPDQGNKNSGEGTENNKNFTGNTVNDGNSSGEEDRALAVKEAERSSIVQSAKSVLASNKIGTQNTAKENGDIQSQLTAYTEAGGSEADFWAALEGKYYKWGKEEGAIGATTAGFNDKEDKWFDLTLWDETSKQKDTKVETGRKASNSSELTELWNATKTDAMEKGGFNTVVTGSGDDAKLFIRKKGGTWYEVLDQGANLTSNADTRPSGLINYAKAFRARQFKTGGLADFTGPAWLDGTKSHPEYVLNSAQTEKFFALIDVLEKYNTEDTQRTTGDNYFDIDINVEKLEDDYDLEQIANKIRGMIYEDATYRNVNAINRR